MKTIEPSPTIDGLPPVLENIDGPSLIERLLAEQQQLTAVEQFALDHAEGAPPALAEHYTKLLPASPPGPGQQYAFDVDLDSCSGCKACVTACHTLNGLDEEETWRDVGLLAGGTASNPVMQHVTTACHHCLEPACMSACPVDAYEKDPITGIVKHLDDQCFGCQYCTLACPYDVPKYHSAKGIVRKCDMCSSRLSAGEAPACVQACPHEAISITVVETQQVIENAEADSFLPAAPEPHLTLPTTNYRTKRVFPRNMLPADYRTVHPQHSHWPLIVMLVLTQFSVGAFVVGMFLESQLAPELLKSFGPLHATIALCTGLLALSASVLHLGRPQYAFRAVIGLRHSWLSREILAFGLFAPAACLYAGSTWITSQPAWITFGLGYLVGVAGLSGLFCSVMIYAVTGREGWSFARTGTRFLLTAAILGIAATWLSMLLLDTWMICQDAEQMSLEIGQTLVQALLITSGVKLLFEISVLRHLLSRRSTPLKRTAELLVGPLSNQCLARFACGMLGGIVMPLFLWAQQAGETQVTKPATVIVVAMLFVACLAGELLERYLFFASVAAPRMPGGLRT